MLLLQYLTQNVTLAVISYTKATLVEILTRMQLVLQSKDNAKAILLAIAYTKATIIARNCMYSTCTLIEISYTRASLHGNFRIAMSYTKVALLAIIHVLIFFLSQ